MGYDATQIEKIINYAVGLGTLQDAPALNHAQLRAKGFGDEQIATIESGLASAFDIKFVFNKWTLGEEFCKSVLKISDEQLVDYGFDLLSFIGFSKADIDKANIHVCGAMTLEGAPGLKDEHLPGVRLRQCLRPPGQALSLGGKPHPHDGGKPALYLGGHFQDHQHAE